MVRTSESLNEGLPIKIAKEKFQRKRFLHEKYSWFSPPMICESAFSIGKVQIKKYGLKTLFLLLNINAIENALLKCFPLCDQTIYFTCSCIFALYISYEKWHDWSEWGRLSKCSKQFIIKVSKGAKIRNRYNQVPHLTQDTNGKVTNSQKTPQTRAKRSALSQQVTTKHI